MANMRIPSDTPLPSLTATSDLPEALRAPTNRVGPAFITLLCLANVALWLSMTPVSGILMPLQVIAIDVPHAVQTLADRQHYQNDLALILSVGTAVSIFSNAIGGALSDRTTSRFGRRRPWLLLCALLSAGTLALLATASNVAVLVLGWALYQLFANGALAALVAVVPDRVPERQRGVVSAFVGLALPLALVIGSVLIGIVYAAIFPTFATEKVAGYATLIVVLLAVMLLFVLFLPDPALPRSAVSPFHLGRFLAGFWLSPRRYPDFGWAWITRFLVILGYSTAIGSFLLFFVRDAVHYESRFPGHSAQEGVAFVQVVSVVFLLISSVIGGVLSDRFQRRKLFVMVATVLIAIALVLLAFFDAWPNTLVWPMILVAGGILGFGFGAYLAVDIALLTQVLPSAQDRGKDMGVFNIANALPQALAPIVGALILSQTGNNYSVMFIAAAVAVLLGAVLVQPIKSVR